jgi:S1-C subfamily serine protease
MTSSRSDRPYGSFPGSGRTPPPPEVPAPAPRPTLRARLWGRLATPLALVSMLALTWVLVGAIQAGGARTLESVRQQPAPTPTPPLAALVYESVAPSVVQVSATGAGDQPSSGAGVIVDDQADILTSLHIVKDAKTVTVRFADGSESAAEVVAALAD